MAKKISKSKLKAKMLEIFRNLEKSGDEFIVIHNGKPVLKITPLKENGNVSEIFSGIQDKVTFLEDINSPTYQEWSET